MKKFRIRNPCESFVLCYIIAGIKQFFKYMLGIDDEENDNNELILPDYDKNGNKEYQQYKKVYFEQHVLDGKVFLSCMDEHGQPALPVTNLNDSRQVMVVMQSLNQNGTNGHHINGTKNGYISNGNKAAENTNGYTNGYSNGYTNGHKNGSSNGHVVQCLEVVPNKCRRSRANIDPEYWKFILSILYIFVVHFFSTYCIILAQERLPDKTKYRPLPDIVLDYVPYVPWAYRVTEGTIYVLIFGGLTLAFFHKNRFIVLRRAFFMSGSVYLLRAICIIVTSLPMPQEKYNCDRLDYKDTWTRFQRAIIVYLGMGMKVTGMKTCGDYMYSGHTVILTLLIYFINTYSPRRWVLLHILVWISGLTGIVFIFLSHGHYSIDVIIAFAISSRIFAGHHVIADNIDLMKRNRGMLRKWFPLVYAMEKNCTGIIPNEYEWPLPPIRRIKQYFKGKPVSQFLLDI